VAVEAVEQLGGRVPVDPGGGQLDRRRQAVEPRQSAATAGRVAAVSAKSASAARARSANNTTAGDSAAGRPSPGSGNGGTR
jgi:hypothetical protein